MATTFLIPSQLAFAQDNDDNKLLEEVIVTAQKTAQNLQDVPVSVQVLGNKKMEDLNVNNFDDYIKFLPTVSYQRNRPGNAQIYMRGISSGGDGNHSASMPSVGVYLDEQPITTINQILDMHMYDINRVETLSGPQGTLYGASSQAGTMKIVTNKPDVSGFEAGYDITGDKVSHGELGYSLEGFVNMPLSDTAALRVVAWDKKEGGYIDNVHGVLNYAASGIVRDNSDLIEKNFNDTATTGMRAALGIDLGENWTATPSLTYQKQRNTGDFTHDPEDIGDLKSKTFFPTVYDENWYQASLTLEGKVGDLDVVYAGSYLDRNVDSTYDYIGYAEYLEDVYAASGAVCYNYDSISGECTDASQYVSGDEKFFRQSHEFRVSSDQNQRLRWIAGAFFQKQTHDFDLQWTTPDLDPVYSVIEGGHTVWQTYQVREDREKAAFAEIYYDVSEKLSVMGGVRFFNFNNSLYGFNGFLGHCTGVYNGGKFVEDRTNGVPQYPCFDTKILDDVSKGSGKTLKFNANYQIDDDKMVYATYSEGYRPGGVNRARVPGIPKYQTDYVTNYELGWKTTLLEGKARFNGSIYVVDWDDFQYGFLDFTISNLTIIGNVGQARSKGAEFDLTYQVDQDFTLSVAGSYNDSKLKDPYYRNSDERQAGGAPRAPIGQEMPFVPKLQMTAIARKSFELEGVPAFAQVALSHTGGSWSDLESAKRLWQNPYTIINTSFGYEGDDWSLTVFINNLTDTRAQIARYDPGYPSGLDTTTAVNRPRSVGMRFGQKF